MKSEIENLRSRLKSLIVGTCNKLGCARCDLRYDNNKTGGDCSATDLQGKIDSIEFREVK